MRTVRWAPAVILALYGAIALFGLGQFPPGTPQVTQCRLFSTDYERSLDDVHLSTSSYFVKIGAKPVLLHLDFTAYAVAGLKPEHALVTVQSRIGSGSVSGRPALVGQDRYAIDLPLTGLSQPYYTLISFRSKGVWWEFSPKCE
jgi:hypothetical protein